MRIAALSTALALWANVSAAQTACMEYAGMVSNFLAAGIYKHSEGLTMSPQGEPARMELWLSDSGAFAVVGVINDEIGCLIIAGDYYSEADDA